MGEFGPAVERLLELEGGYVNDPADPGGETRWGITKRTYPHLDIASLTRAQAEEIYWRDFWEPLGLGEPLWPQAIADRMLSNAVLMGPKTAVRLLQRALRAVGEELEDDGRLGPVTRGAVARAPVPELLAALRSETAGHLRSLVVLDGDLVRFERGWMRRAYA